MLHYRLFLDSNDQVIIVEIKDSYEEVVSYDVNGFIGTTVYYSKQEAEEALYVIIENASKILTWKDRLEMASHEYTRRLYDY